MNHTAKMMLTSMGLVFAAVACGSSSGNGGSNGATSGGSGGTGGGMCTQFTSTCSCNTIMSTGEPGLCFEAAGANCQADGGSMGANCMSQGPSCPTANRVGTCWPPMYDADDTDTRYYSPTYTTATAETACMATGACFIAN